MNDLLEKELNKHKSDIILRLKNYGQLRGVFCPTKKELLSAIEKVTGSKINNDDPIVAILCWYESENFLYEFDIHAIINPKPKMKYTTFDGKETNDFYHSQEWRSVRYRVLKDRGAKCGCCGHTAASSGSPLHVDHIKPRSLYPELELEESNLQILCVDCNMGKGHSDSTDWTVEKVSRV